MHQQNPNGIECILVGHNNVNFDRYLNTIKQNPNQQLYLQTLELDYFWHNKKPYRAMDILNHFRSDFPLYNGDLPSLTLSYLGTYLKRRGISVAHVDDFSADQEIIKSTIETRRPLCIGITTTLYLFDTTPLEEIVAYVRSCDKNIPIVIGGPLVLNNYNSDNKEDWLKFHKAINADFYIVNSEGEETFVKLIKCLRQGINPAGLDNLIVRAEAADIGKIKIQPEDNDLSKERVDWRAFYGKEECNSISFRASKSCPFSCLFCGYPIRNGAYRPLSVDEIRTQLLELHNLKNIRYINFIDDTLNCHPEKFLMFLRMMVEENFQFKWNCYLRCQLLDEETVDLMARSGCIGTFLGIESANNQILTNMNKKAKVEDYRRGIRLLHDYGIMTHSNYIVGFPGENKDSVQETIDFINETKTTFYRAQLWYCDLLTPVWRERKRFGIRGWGYNWEHETMKSEEALEAVQDIFEKVTHSIRLPQENFNVNGVYAMLYAGYTLDQAKKFLVNFNKIIRFKQVHRGALVPEGMLELLKEALAH